MKYQLETMWREVFVCGIYFLHIIVSSSLLQTESLMTWYDESNFSFSHNHLRVEYSVNFCNILTIQKIFKEDYAL